MVEEEKKKEQYTYKEIEDEVPRTPHLMTRGEYIVWLLNESEKSDVPQ